MTALYVPSAEEARATVVVTMTVRGATYARWLSELWTEPDLEARVFRQRQRRWASMQWMGQHPPVKPSLSRRGWRRS